MKNIKFKKDTPNLPALLVIIAWLSILSFSSMYFLLESVKSGDVKDRLDSHYHQRIEKLEEKVKMLEEKQK